MKYEHIYVMHGTVTVLYRTPQSFLADIEALLQIYIIVPATLYALHSKGGTFASVSEFMPQIYNKAKIWKDSFCKHNVSRMKRFNYSCSLKKILPVSGLHLREVQIHVAG
jgi:hypothetical protein